MEHEKNPDSPGGDMLDIPETAGELGPDEHALTGVEFAKMEDIEVEKIMQETKSQDWDAMLQAMPDILPEAEEEPQEFFGFSGAGDLEEVSADAEVPALPEPQEPADDSPAEPVPEGA